MQRENSISSGFSPSDMEFVVRLVASVGKPGSSVDAIKSKRIALANGVAEFTQADVWIWSTGLIDSENGIAEETSLLVDGRWTNRDEQQRVTARLTANGRSGKHFGTLLQSTPGSQSLRFFEDKNEIDVKLGTTDDVCLVCGLQPGIGSLFFLSPLVFSAVRFHRRLDRPPFQEYEKNITDLIFRNLAWLHHSAIPSQIPRSAAGFSMPPRRREVFEMILNGQKNRVVADKLGISPHTVGDHIKEIYRQFDVKSRGELLAKFIHS